MLNASVGLNQPLSCRQVLWHLIRMFELPQEWEDLPSVVLRWNENAEGGWILALSPEAGAPVFSCPWMSELQVPWLWDLKRKPSTPPPQALGPLASD